MALLFTMFVQLLHILLKQPIKTIGFRFHHQTIFPSLAMVKLQVGLEPNAINYVSEQDSYNHI